jgi:SAM-dependent methyltransferase
MPDKETIAWYDGAALEYAQRFGSGTPISTLSAFMALLPAGGTVLDLGCGPALASVHMRNAGFRPLPVDASQGMVDLANDKHAIGAQLKRFDEIDMVGAFDGVWANFSLLHAPRAALPDHLAAIAKALHPDGILHVAMKTGNGEVRDHLGRLYTLVTVDELHDLLTRAGFRVLSCEEGREKGCAGTDDPFVAICARKDNDA